MDSGDLLWKSAYLGEDEVPQRKLKANLLFAAMEALKVDALTPGEGDFVFGVDFLKEGAARHHLPYVSANLQASDGSALFPSFVVVERAGLRIGITGITAPAVLGKELQAADPNASLTAVVQTLKGSERVDLVVLLSHQGSEADKALLRAVDGVDLVFAAHDRRFTIEPTLVGDTAIFQAGSRGKYLGQVSLDLAEGRTGWSADAARASAERRQASLQRQLARYRGQLNGEADERTKSRVSRAVERVEKQLSELEIPPPDDGTHNRAVGTKVSMGRELADDPAMKELVDATLEQLGDTVTTGHEGHNHSTSGHEGHSHSTSASGKERPPRKSRGPYVGAGVCMGCHAGQYADWADSKHAHAWKTLLDEKRQFDQDCWSCHVTGANKPGGPAHPKAVGSMRNVQCEACHGPGEKHVAAPSKARMLRSPPEKLCVTCHNMEQTEGRFVFEAYREKIDHRP